MQLRTNLFIIMISLIVSLVLNKKLQRKNNKRGDVKDQLLSRTNGKKARITFKIAVQDKDVNLVNQIFNLEGIKLRKEEINVEGESNFLSHINKSNCQKNNKDLKLLDKQASNLITNLKNDIASIKYPLPEGLEFDNAMFDINTHVKDVLPSIETMIIKRVKIYRQEDFIHESMSHELLEFCAVDGERQIFFIVDRVNASNSVVTLIRVIFIAEHKNLKGGKPSCFDEKQYENQTQEKPIRPWLEQRLDKENKSYSKLKDSTNAEKPLNLTFKNLLKMLIFFAAQNPIFKILSNNCQTFTCCLFPLFSKNENHLPSSQRLPFLGKWINNSIESCLTSYNNFFNESKLQKMIFG